MIRNIFIFLATFVGGALATLVIRAAAFNPYKGHEGHPPAKEYSQMVTNTLSPTKSPQQGAEGTKGDTPSSDSHSAHTTEVKNDPHANHAPAAAGKTDTGERATVNTICAICGMPVDPKLPTAEYQGKTIGFGCRMCPPKFKADPDRYGPYYLRNEAINR